MRFLVRSLANLVGIWVSTLIISSVSFAPEASVWKSLGTMILVALIFTAVNSLVRPLVKVVTFPLYILTFGLFALVTNALMFMLTGWLSEQANLGFTVGGFWPAVGAGLITAVISALVVTALPRRSES